MGLSLHTWAGRGHDSNCQISIHPDGSVEASLCTQDLGTGTRTVVAVVAAETLGVPLETIKLNIGDNRLPTSGGSGGSTTVGGVSSSTRRAAVNARDALFAKVAPSLGVAPEQLEAVGGQIRAKGDPSKSLTWKQATAKLGATPIVEMGKHPGDGALASSGVGGVQMAEVLVDVETGIVKIVKMVAVQDCGEIISLKTAEKWIRDALARKDKVMGFGHRVYKTGDVRARILKDYARKAAELAGQTQWEEAAEIIERVLEQEKNLFPNLDWPAGRLYHAIGLEVPLYTPFFVASRITGWCAHIIEQKSANRIIRPRARYTGPARRAVKGLGERG